MLGKPPTTAAIELASSGYRKEIEGRLNVFEPWQSMSKTLNPRASVVLAHQQFATLGIGAMVLHDYPHLQGLIDYSGHPSLTALYDTLARMGVTHVLWAPRSSNGWFGYANDFVFFDFVRDHVGDKDYGGMRLGPMVRGTDVPLAQAKALLLICGNFKPGLYSLASLRFPDLVVTIPERYPHPEREFHSERERDELLREARYVALDEHCAGQPLPGLSEQFIHEASRGNVQLWIRKGNRLTETREPP